MKFNTDPTFVGLDILKQVHNSQISEFITWASTNNWGKFHSSHYDWWVFPINQPNGYGLKYVVYEGEVAELKKDDAFIDKYVLGVQLVSASWGWDLQTKTYIANPKTEQRWHNWPIRLYKAAQSVKLFGYDDLFDSLKIYAQDLMNQGKVLEYNGRDLSWLFKTT